MNTAFLSTMPFNPNQSCVRTGKKNPLDWVKDSFKIGNDKKLVWSMGHDFLRRVKLDNKNTLKEFGLAEIWYARYFAAGATPPPVKATDSAHKRTESQVKMQVRVIDSAKMPEEWLEKLENHIIIALGLKEGELKNFKVKIAEPTVACCDKGCYGCLKGMKQAIPQTNTPSLSTPTHQASVHPAGLIPIPSLNSVVLNPLSFSSLAGWLAGWFSSPPTPPQA
jgi:hypothetical protein